MRPALEVITADQCLSPIFPSTSHRGSSRVRAGISTTSGSFHRSWAATKSIPCLRSFRAGADTQPGIVWLPDPLRRPLLCGHP